MVIGYFVWAAIYGALVALFTALGFDFEANSLNETKGQRLLKAVVVSFAFTAFTSLPFVYVPCALINWYFKPGGGLAFKAAGISLPWLISVISAVMVSFSIKLRYK